MKESFADILAEGGKANSLGRAAAVVEVVLKNKDRLDELYACTLHDDAWVRMRAIDSLEKVCRVHPEWLKAYTGRLLSELAPSEQPSIQWHLAQIFRQVTLTAAQRQQAIKWLKQRVSTTAVDWIVAADTLETLAYFTRRGVVTQAELVKLLTIQQDHHSKAVVKRAAKLLDEFL